SRITLQQEKEGVELERETYIADLDYNRTFPEGVKFVKNKVIEEPEYGLFFIDVFGDEALQRVSDVQKVKTETLLRYKMVAFNDISTTNQRFMLLMYKMIHEQHEKDKLITKKFKLELMGFNDV
ncbi:hypothetical protein Tco_0388396, partial [Tanacetum coccineum]